MLEGYTADRKRKLAGRITDALCEQEGAGREAIIRSHEVSKARPASGGELMIDRSPPK
jgi:hypothetical protein